jgi:hypothetical protein
VVMNHRIFVNEVTDMIDGIFIQPSKTNQVVFICIFVYLFSGIDIPHECMPNKFSHILFGKVKSHI